MRHIDEKTIEVKRLYSFSRLIVFGSLVLVSRLASHVSCPKGRVNACGKRVNAADGLASDCLIVHSTSLV